VNEIIITVEGLGKRYLLRHQKSERYTALRDVITEKAKSLFRPVPNERDSSAREEFWALKDVSFEVKRGEVLGIVGRNGAGKSTLLKILSRVTDPTEGRVKIRGRVASLLEVGTGFHPELTGRENIFLNGAILGMSRAEIKSKFDEIVDFAEVTKFLDTPVKRYSSGMYVRLAFAVAAHLEPEILVVDEVLAVGDAEFQKKCLGKMGEVSNTGRTILFVSHNMAAMQTLCSTGALLRDGLLLRFGNIGPVIRAYLERTASQEFRNLAERSDRGGTGSLRVLALRCSGSLSGKRALIVGTPAVIECRVSAPAERLIFGVYDNNAGCLISDFDSAIPSPSDLHDGAGVVVRCHIDALLLKPGSYFINVAAFDKHGMADHLQRAIDIEVAEGLVAERPISQAWRGFMVQPHRWEFA
jgi:lipopolysaccharide transport system ATP-binding protein